jgi:hypothetical protein
MRSTHLAAFALGLAPVGLLAVSVPHTFTNGTVADADQVNANFDAVTAGISANLGMAATGPQPACDRPGLLWYDQGAFHGCTESGWVTFDVTAPPPPGTTIVQGPDDLDAYIRSPPLAPQDWSDAEWLRVGGWADQYYSLLQFDLSGLPTTHATQAVVRLRVKSVNNAPSMYLDRVTGSWTEAVSWSGQPGATNLTTLPPASAADTWYEIDITGTFNGWVDGTYGNYGIRLRPTVYNANNFNEFWSGDYATAEFRPQLVVTY